VKGLYKVTEPQHDQGHVMHYAFAHRHLTDMAFEEPQLILSAALDGRLPDILNRIWKDMNSNLSDADKREGEIGVELKKLDDGVLIVVLMPEPEIPPEAKYMALAFQQTPAQELMARCFTLELSYDNTFALGVWSPDRTHGIISRSSGDLGDFLKEVKDLISQGDGQN
jgi:hypothetical protein